VGVSSFGGSYSLFELPPDCIARCAAKVRWPCLFPRVIMDDQACPLSIVPTIQNSFWIGKIKRDRSRAERAKARAKSSRRLWRHSTMRRHRR
jgi:hypothetical protein